MEPFFKPYVCLGHISQSFTQNINIILALTKFVIYKIRKLLCVIRKEVSKYCSKLTMQTVNWILTQFSSFAKTK